MFMQGTPFCYLFLFVCIATIELGELHSFVIGVMPEYGGVLSMR
jgi:hypothetical protein